MSRRPASATAIEMDPLGASGSSAIASDQSPQPSQSPSYEPSAANSSPSTLPSQPSRHSRSVSVSSFTGSVSSKSRYAEPGTSDIHAERSSFSSSPHSTNLLRSGRSWPYSRRHSAASEALTEELYLGESQQQLFDNDTPRMRPNPDSTGNHSALPEPALTTRSSFSDSHSIQSKRLSGTSLYSLASARGVVASAPPSNRSSDQGESARSVSGLMSSAKGTASAPPEAALSNVTVTTSSTAQSGHASPTNHSLAARDSQAHHDLVRRNQRSETMRGSQPDRSRSRAKRRFSGSTAYSSQSPSSERGPHHREKEEGALAKGEIIFLCVMEFEQCLTVQF